MNINSVTERPLDDMAGSELLAEYNAITGESVKKFASTTVGRIRLAKAREQAKNTDAAMKGEKPVTEDFESVTEEQHRLHRGEVAEKNEADPVRSAGIKKSWEDPEVAAKRKERSGVLVDGKHSYDSVRKAFIALGLPLGKHIKFRGDLKSAGSLELNYEGRVYHFSVCK